MNNQELLNNAIANLSNEEKAAIFPAITRKNFVVRKNWLGRKSSDHIREQEKCTSHVQS